MESLNVFTERIFACLKIPTKEGAMQTNPASIKILAGKLVSQKILPRYKKVLWRKSR